MRMEMDGLLKAVAEPTRLRVLNLLRMGSICVCDLQAVLSLPQPTVSRHLAALRHAGLVTDQRQGNRMLYALTAATTPQIQGLFVFIEKCAQCEPLLQSDLHALEEALSAGHCQTTEPSAKGEAA